MQKLLRPVNNHYVYRYPAEGLGGEVYRWRAIARIIEGYVVKSPSIPAHDKRQILRILGKGRTGR